MYTRYITQELRDEIAIIIAATNIDNWNDMPFEYKAECTAIYVERYYDIESDECWACGIIEGNDLLSLFLNMMREGYGNSDRSFDFIYASKRAMVKAFDKHMTEVFETIYNEIN